MPQYGRLLTPEETIPNYTVAANVTLIWLMWYVQSFFMLVVLTNFIIAVITNTYNQVIVMQRIISYRHKADLNVEIFELFNLFNKLEKFQLLLFSSGKEFTELNEDYMAEILGQLKKFIMKENKNLQSKSKELQNHFVVIKSNQKVIENNIMEKFIQIEEKHEARFKQLEEKIDGAKRSSIVF